MSIPNGHVSEDARLSKMLFEARELIDMHADMVRARTGSGYGWPERVRDEIDAYRAERGWSPHGFGGEGDAQPEPVPQEPSAQEKAGAPCTCLEDAARQPPDPDCPQHGLPQEPQDAEERCGAVYPGVGVRCSWSKGHDKISGGEAHYGMVWDHESLEPQRMWNEVR